MTPPVVTAVYPAAQEQTRLVPTLLQIAFDGHGSLAHGTVQ